VDLTNSVTLVAVTNVTVSTNLLAYGTNPVTLTAQMTPVNAGQFVEWSVTNGSGQFSTNQGLSTTFLPTAGGGTYTIQATCGSSSATVVIHVYELTGVTASPNPVAAGEPVTLTALVVPAGCPLPINWNVSSDTGLCITNTFGAGYHTVTASLGDMEVSCVATSVMVAEIKYEAVPNSGNWLAWPAPAYFPKGSTFRVRAIPNPYDPNKPDAEQWPSGKPVWGGAAGGTEPISTATFGVTSTNAIDYKLVSATCANAVTNKAVVYEFFPVATPVHNFTNRSTNQFGIAERIQLKAQLLPFPLPVPSAVGTWDWSIASEGDTHETGLLTDPIGTGSSTGSETLYGPLIANTIDLTLWHEPKHLPGTQLTKSTNLTFVSPSVTFLKGPGPGGRQGFPEVSGFIDIKVTPADVSWQWLKVGEVDGQLAVALGFMAGFNGTEHQNGLNEFAVRTANGWFTAQSDKIGSFWLADEPPANFAAGTWKWLDVPWFTYALHSTNDMRAEFVASSHVEAEILSANNQWEIFITRLGIEFRRKVNDATVNLDATRQFQSID
jgi:hypothetical protein